MLPRRVTRSAGVWTRPGGTCASGVDVRAARLVGPSRGNEKGHAHELAGRVRRRDLSPVEVVDAFIARVAPRNPSLNALVYLGFDGARREAKAAEDAVMQGADLGPRDFKA